MSNTWCGLIGHNTYPFWAACLIVAGVPFQMIAYPTRLGILQVLGFALVFIGSIPAALALLKFGDEQAAY
jgi:hypothetical protein